MNHCDAYIVGWTNSASRCAPTAGSMSLTMCSNWNRHCCTRGSPTCRETGKSVPLSFRRRADSRFVFSHVFGKSDRWEGQQSTHEMTKAGPKGGKAEKGERGKPTSLGKGNPRPCHVFGKGETQGKPRGNPGETHAPGRGLRGARGRCLSAAPPGARRRPPARSARVRLVFDSSSIRRPCSISVRFEFDSGHGRSGVTRHGCRDPRRLILSESVEQVRLEGALASHI